MTELITVKMVLFHKNINLIDTDPNIDIDRKRIPYDGELVGKKHSISNCFYYSNFT